MAGKPKYSDAELAAALTQYNGLITVAATMLKCDPDTIHRRRKKSKAIGKAIETARVRRVDRAEMKLDSAVGRGEPWAVALVLRTLGRDRGYIEKGEAPTPIDAAPMITIIEVIRPSPGPAQLGPVTVDALPDPPAGPDPVPAPPPGDEPHHRADRPATRPPPDLAPAEAPPPAQDPPAEPVDPDDIDTDFDVTRPTR